MPALHMQHTIPAAMRMYAGGQGTGRSDRPSAFRLCYSISRAAIARVNRLGGCWQSAWRRGMWDAQYAGGS